MDKSIRHTGHVKEAIKSRNRDEGQYSLPYEIMVCVTHKSLSLSLRVETIGIYSLVDLGAIQHFKGTVSKSMLPACQPSIIILCVLPSKYYEGDKMHIPDA
jgi:hypothetical protein